nr:NodA family N-acyltransferase [Azorhizobium doebereinerae]
MGAGVVSSIPKWSLRWESDLDLTDHSNLAEFFRRVYGPTGSANALPFEGVRSWAGARPELRAIAYDASGVAAHMGVLRRFIRVGEVDLLVAELGLYGVRRDLEGLGIGHSVAALTPTLHKLGVPFAFGTFRPELKAHFQRFCRGGAGELLENMKIKSTLANVYPGYQPTRVEDVLVVVLPIRASIEEWPSSQMMNRNGPEL